MESMEITIATFINPHFFFILDSDSEHRSAFLQDLSARIKRSVSGWHNDTFLVDEMVAAYHQNDLVRATILDKLFNSNTNLITYFCWLVDYATIIKTDKVFKLSKEFQKITPRVKQASLNNICYLKEQLELGVTGKKTTVPSVVAPSGVSLFCLNLLQSGYSKLIFEVAERYNNILIGEIIIHKDEKVFKLSETLCKEQLVAIDELIFQRIKFRATDFLKANVEAIYQICKTQKIAEPVKSDSETSLSTSKISYNSLYDDLDESDSNNSLVLENGRRRRSVKSQSPLQTMNKSVSPLQTSESEDDQKKQKNDNKISRLLEKFKKSQLSNTNKKPDEETSEVSNKKLDSSDNIVLCGIPEVSEVATQKNTEILDDIKENIQLQQNVDLSKSLESKQKIVSPMASLVQKLKEKKQLEESKKVLEEGTVKVLPGSDATWMKLVELRKKRKTLSCSSKSEEGLDSSYESNLEDSHELKLDNIGLTSTPKSTIPDTSESDIMSNGNPTSSSVTSNTAETKKSPFSDITSQRKGKPAGFFLPAGNEGTYVKSLQKSSRESLRGGKFKTKNVPLTTTPPKTESISTPDDDCPTIKIPKVSDTLTDEDHISSGEVKKKPTKNDDESSSSDLTTREIFTKQDFCRLVAGCTCVKCRITLEDDDWDSPLVFGSQEVVSKKKKIATEGVIIKPSKLLRKEIEGETHVQENEILSIDYGSMSSMEKKISCKVLVHGESIPNPIKRVSQVNIHQDIYNNISRLNYKEAKRIQHYAFPAITRNQHVFMINDAGSGKTMAYTPILCSFIMEKADRYSQLFKMGGGPIVVILCSSSKKCEEINDLFRLVLDRQRCKVSLVTYPGYGNISNIDVLITMPTILTNLISSRATNFKRLCHLVLEDGDTILKSHNDLVRKFLDYADQVLDHRHCPKSIQLIVCAEHWTPPIEDIFKKLNKVPLVCIGNYLEAALYGKLSFTMKFLDSGCKEQYLQNILQDVYKFTKSIIICNREEVEDIVAFLPLKGIEFTAILDSDDNDDSAYIENVWTNAIPGKYSVLICDDDMYNTINITNAQILIHYSLPRSWTQFIRRFSCLLEHNPTPLNIKQRKDKVSSYVFIDEKCEQRMSKFCNFIKIAGLEKDLPEKVKDFFKGVTIEEEHHAVLKKIELCENIKLFGRCDALHCKKRHLVDKELDRSDTLPKNGTVKFKIVKMTNACACSIKLVEHFDLEGRSVEKYEDYTNEITEVLALKDNYRYESKPVENKLYLHKDGETYQRCKLLEMGEFALVYLLDRGIYCKSSLDKLFRMPDDLKKIPQQCYEVYLANLIPPHEDTTFSRSAKHKAQFMIDSNCPNSLMTARISLQIGNNLWLDDVCEELDMHDKTLPTIGFQLSREVIKQGLAVRSDKPLEDLYSLCTNAGIALPEYKIKKQIVKKVAVEQVKPQWAFLDIDDVHEVVFSCGISPGEFYVKHQKFAEQRFKLEEDIQKEISRPFYPVPQKIEVGKCYLAKDEQSEAYSRVLLLQLATDKARVFFVDHADEAIIPLSDLKHISNDLISRLPFQTIQCSMYGIKPIGGDWGDDANDFLYKLAYEENSDVFRSLFVKVCSRQENSFIAGQSSYSVLIKDGYNERHCLLNELLIDCGFAIPSGDEIRDFELPERVEESEDEELEDFTRSEADVVVEDEGYYPTDDYPDLNFDDFDLEILDPSAFLQEMNIARKNDGKKSIEDTKYDYDDLPPMKALPAVDYLTPKVYWSQTDSGVRLKIMISDVQVPRITLLHNRMFQFNTEINGNKYKLKLIFYEKVEKTFQYTILGPEVRLTLTKCKPEEWPRLSYSQEKLKNVHYDFTTLKDEEKPKRLPLQLDISDSSSEDGERDGMVYHVVSDLDSEFDYDIPNDEEV